MVDGRVLGATGWFTLGGLRLTRRACSYPFGEDKTYRGMPCASSFVAAISLDSRRALGERDAGRREGYLMTVNAGLLPVV